MYSSLSAAIYRTQVAHGCNFANPDLYLLVLKSSLFIYFKPIIESYTSENLTTLFAIYHNTEKSLHVRVFFFFVVFVFNTLCEYHTENHSQNNSF